MKIRDVLIMIIAGIVPSIMLYCNGGSTEIGNARLVTGEVTDNRVAVGAAVVSLVEESYIPGEDADGKVFTTETDCTGMFRFTEIPNGTFYLNAEKGDKVLLEGPFFVVDQDLDLSERKIAEASTIRLTVDDTVEVSTVYIKGTVHAYPVKAGTVELPAVPEGTVTLIGYNPVSEKYISHPQTAAVKVTIAVNEASSMSASFTNTPPQFTVQPQAENQLVDVATRSYSYQLAAKDAENDPLQFRIKFGLAGMWVDNNNGLVVWSPDSSVKSGTYGITVEVSDTNGGSSSISWMVTLVDDVFILDGSPHSFSGIVGATYLVNTTVNFGVVNAVRFAWGDGDTTGWQRVSTSSHMWKTAGTYPLSYQTQNSSDGSFSTWIGPVSVTVTGVMVDTFPPILDLAGDSIMYLMVGKSYIEPGYSAYDLQDGVKSGVTVSGTVDVNEVGEYQLLYTARDLSGNTAVRRRLVYVTDLTIDMDPPVVHLTGPDTLFVPDSQRLDDFIASFVEPGYSAVDAVDGDVTAGVKVTMYPPDAAGNFYIEYTAADKSGNAISVRRWIISNVGDPVVYPPVILLVYGDSVIQHKVNTRWVEPGFAVTDVQDGTISSQLVIVDSSEFIANRNTIGTYGISYQVANSLGLVTVKMRYVQVVNEFSNAIELFGRNPDTMVAGSGPYIEPGYQAFDQWGNELTENVIIYSDMDTTGTLGVYTLTYTVEDSAMRVLTARRTVVVVSDTFTQDLFVRYNVPSPDPFPSVEGMWAVAGFDGDTTGLTRVRELGIIWNLEAKRLDTLQFIIDGISTVVDLDTVPNTLSSPQPQLQFDSTFSTGVAALDRSLYVTMKSDSLMVWVATDGTYAILWSR